MSMDYLVKVSIPGFPAPCTIAVKGVPNAFEAEKIAEELVLDAIEKMQFETMQMPIIKD